METMSYDLIGIFGAGLFTFVTPCVLPLVPVYLAALTGSTVTDLPHTSRSQLLTRALWFSAGLILVFASLGSAASSLGSLLHAYRPHLMTAGGLLILLFGLKFLGLIQIPLFDRILRGNDNRLKTRYGALNALLMGALFAAGWSPCVGPILGSVLTYTASAADDPLVGAGYLALYGLGFALPLAMTAAFASAVLGMLRRLHPHLPKIERAVGLLLIVVAATFLFAPTGNPNSSAKHLACAGQKPTMVELYSETCPICQEMKPVVRSVVAECQQDDIDLRSYDVRDPNHRSLVSQYRVVGVPTYLFIDSEGDEVARLVGRQSEGALNQALATLVGRECPGVGPMPAVVDESETEANCEAIAANPEGSDTAACTLQ